MLAADKLYLEGKLARGVTRLKWKEFSLHHLNLTTVSTQASVLAGFGFAALVKFHTHEEPPAFLLFGFYTCTMLQLSANILCIATTTMLSVCGTSLSMRGADGSIVRSVDSIYSLRRHVFGLFWLGIAATVWTGIFYCWIIFDVVHALVSSSLLLLTLVLLWRWRRQITELFYFARDEATRFCDLRPLTGPRALPRASSAIG